MWLICPIPVPISHSSYLITIADNNHTFSVRHILNKNYKHNYDKLQSRWQATSRDDELNDELLAEIAEAKQVFEQMNDLHRWSFKIS